MIRLLRLSGVVLLLIMTAAAPAIAGDKDVSGEEGTVTITAEESGDTTTTGDGGDASAVFTVAKPYTEYRYVPTCRTNGPEGGDALCGAAVYTCPDEGDIRFRVYTRQHAADGSLADGAGFEAQGTECRGPDEEAEGGPVQITTADIRDVARKAAPASVVHVQPGDRSYVNVPTNFYADTTAKDATVQVLGQSVQLRFDPAGYRWDYGDGSSGTGAGAKSAGVGAADAVEHAYRRHGAYDVTLTRSFEVTFTLPGGQDGQLPTPLTTTSDAYPLPIGEIQSTVTDIG